MKTVLALEAELVELDPKLDPELDPELPVEAVEPERCELRRLRQEITGTQFPIKVFSQSTAIPACWKQIGKRNLNRLQ